MTASLYWDFHHAVVYPRRQIWSDIYAVILANAVTVGDVNYYLDSANLRTSSRRLARASVGVQTALAREGAVLCSLRLL